MAACVPEIEPGHFRCEPDQVGAICPEGWSCVTLGPLHACSPWRATEADCGNGVVDPGEECDWAVASPFNCVDFGLGGTYGFCDRDCAFKCPYGCGDGMLQGAEECDDGNAVGEDGCSADCKVEALAWEPLLGEGPPARSAHGMAYDQAHDLVVLFGGAGIALDGHNGTLGDTWVFDGALWQEVALTDTPEPRYGHVMAYDSQHQVTVVFGGFDGQGSFLQDVWEFDGEGWTRAGDGPTELWESAMASADGGGLLVFGGNKGACCNFASGDTWVYDGETWTVPPTLTSPYKRWGHAMASGPNITVLHGGQRSQNIQTWDTFHDTWIWGSGGWQIAATGDRAPERTKHALVYFPPWGKFVLFGGSGAFGTSALGDTWLFNPTTQTWDRVATLADAPPARALHRMVLDTLRERIVLFGGTDGAASLGDTWVATAP